MITKKVLTGSVVLSYTKQFALYEVRVA